MAVLPIITNIKQLRIPCKHVEAGEDIKQILIDLKDTCIAKGGWGISHNQLGGDKCISYIHVPFKDVFVERYIINAEIIEHDKKFTWDEGCISFKGLFVKTDRWIFITAQYQDENLKPQIECFQDYVSFAVQHEVDHQNGKIFFMDRKHRAC